MASLASCGRGPARVCRSQHGPGLRGRLWFRVDPCVQVAAKLGPVQPAKIMRFWHKRGACAAINAAYAGTWMRPRKSHLSHLGFCSKVIRMPVQSYFKSPHMPLFYARITDSSQCHGVAEGGHQDLGWVGIPTVLRRAGARSWAGGVRRARRLGGRTPVIGLRASQHRQSQCSREATSSEIKLTHRGRLPKLEMKRRSLRLYQKNRRSISRRI